MRGIYTFRNNNRLSQGFRFCSSLSAAYETVGLGCGFEGSRLGKGILFRSYTKGKIRRATIEGSQNKVRCAARERFGSTSLSSVRKRYLEEATRVLDYLLKTV
jgi:hypothetical protein